MTASWMLYALAIGVGASLTALAAERALGLLGGPRRWVWAVALAFSALAPVLLPLWSLLSRWPSAAATPVFTPPETPVMVLAAPAPAAPVVDRSIDWARAVDAALTWGWLAASLVGVLVLLGSAVSLGRVRSRWRHARVAGVRVLVSSKAGPAVVGCFFPAIVVPEWVLALAPEQRRLIVMHEREHLWARDPLLIAAALGAVVVAPWNLALWWQLRRLRLAIEVDCDRRMLSGAADLRRYGELLIEIGRRARRSWLPAAAFSEPASFLERRIHAMTSRSPRGRASGAAALLALVLAAPAALSAAPVVSHPLLARLAESLAQDPVARVAPAFTPARTGDAPAARRAEAGPQPFRIIALVADPLAQQGPADSVPDGIGGYAYKGALDRVPELSNRGSIAVIQDRLYPAVLRAAGIGGTVVMQFVVEGDGTPNMRTAKLAEDTNVPDLVEPTIRVLERFRFRPGRVGERNVRVIIQMPITWDPTSQAQGPGAALGVSGAASPMAARTPQPLARGVGAATTPTVATAQAAGPRVVRSESAVGAASVQRATAELRGQLERVAVATGETVRANEALLATGSSRSASTETTLADTDDDGRTIIERAKILIAQRYPALLAETTVGSAALFVVVSPDGSVRDSWLVRPGETFSWPAGTPTNFKRVTTFRSEVVLRFAPALIGRGIVWAEL